MWVTPQRLMEGETNIYQNISIAGQGWPRAWWAGAAESPLEGSGCLETSTVSCRLPLVVDWRSDAALLVALWLAWMK